MARYQLGIVSIKGKFNGMSKFLKLKNGGPVSCLANIDQALLRFQLNRDRICGEIVSLGK